MRLIAIIFFTCVFVPILSAQSDSNHPIDIRLDACLEEDSSTHGTVACLDAAYLEWDTELNRVYQQLLIELEGDQEAIDVLRTTQRAWIDFREAEFAFLNNLYGGLSGTMWRMIHVGQTVDFVRSRTNALSEFLWAMAPD